MERSLLVNAFVKQKSDFESTHRNEFGGLLEDKKVYLPRYICASWSPTNFCPIAFERSINKSEPGPLCRTAIRLHQRAKELRNLIVGRTVISAPLTLIESSLKVAQWLARPSKMVIIPYITTTRARDPSLTCF